MLSPPSDPVSGQCPTGQTSPSAALGFGSHHCTCDCVLDCRNNSGLDCFLTVSFIQLPRAWLSRDGPPPAAAAAAAFFSFVVD